MKESLNLIQTRERVTWFLACARGLLLWKTPACRVQSHRAFCESVQSVHSELRNVVSLVVFKGSSIKVQVIKRG